MSAALSIPCCIPPKKSDTPFPIPEKSAPSPPGFFPCAESNASFLSLFLPPGSSLPPICPPVLAYTTLLVIVGRLVPPPIAFIDARVSVPYCSTAPRLITNSPGVNMAGMVSLLGPEPGTTPPLRAFITFAGACPDPGAGAFFNCSPFSSIGFISSLVTASAVAAPSKFPASLSTSFKSLFAASASFSVCCPNPKSCFVALINFGRNPIIKAPNMITNPAGPNIIGMNRRRPPTIAGQKSLKKRKTVCIFFSLSGFWNQSNIVSTALPARSINKPFFNFSNIFVTGASIFSPCFLIALRDFSRPLSFIFLFLFSFLFFSSASNLSFAACSFLSASRILSKESRIEVSSVGSLLPISSPLIFLD